MAGTATAIHMAVAIAGTAGNAWQLRNPVPDAPARKSAAVNVGAVSDPDSVM